MNKTLGLLVLLLLPALASAQETYSISATAGQVTDLAGIVTAHNERTCERLGQAASCTQAQACTAAGLASGCSAATARNNNVRIFPATQAGREEFVTHMIVAPRFVDMKAAVDARAREKFRAACLAASQSERDAACAAIPNAGSSCGICP